MHGGVRGRRQKPPPTRLCRAMEEMRDEAARKATRKRNIEIAMDMLDLKKTIASLTYENISKTSKLTVDEVKQLEKEINA